MSEQSRNQFDVKLIELFDKKDQSSSHLTGEKYKWIINRLIGLSVGDVKKVTKDYRLIKTYELIAIPFGEKTVQRLKKPNTNLLYVSHDDMFDTIREIHLASGHGARDVMHDRAKKQYVNLTKEVLQLYSDLCEECQLKKNSKARRLFVDVKPVVSNILNFRCQVDIVDMQAQPDGNFHFLMNYQDYATKFVTLRPLRTNQAGEVANHLVDIFCTFGCPLIIQSNYGRKYSRKIVHEVNDLWPDCVLVHGKSQSSFVDSLERSSQDIEIVIYCWMKDNKTNRWSDGLRFIQWQQNNRKHLDTNKTPFASMFYENSRLGLKSTNLSPEIIAGLDSQEDLEEILNTTSVTLDIRNKDPVSLVKPDAMSRLPPSLMRMDAPVVSRCPPEQIASSSANAMAVLKRLSPTEGLSLSMDLPIATPETGKAVATAVATSDDLLSRSGIHFETICSVCEFAYVGSHKCSSCNNFCHEKPPCSKVIQVGADAIEIICLLCERSKQDQRSELKDTYMKQTAPNAKRYKHAAITDNLALGAPLPVVDRMHPRLHPTADGCASPSFPITDSKPVQPCKPFAYKARSRPALFKFNSGIPGHGSNVKEGY